MSIWISVDSQEKPPLHAGEESISDDILLYVPAWKSTYDTGVRMGNYLHRSKLFRPNGSLGCEKYVTHWTPIPAPPETV